MLTYSPLTRSADVRLIEKTPVREIAASWRRLWDIDIDGELAGTDSISLYECLQSGMRFFTPPHVAGTGRLYEQLDRFPWYYTPDKWEHRLALNDLRGCRSVLEFGCGSGSFIKSVHGCSIEGVELNEHAVATARADGLTIHQKSLTELIRDGHRYDGFCAFQVLEHMADPRSFLESAVALLDDCGKLILSVPSMDCFTKYADSNPLDEPPHHMTQWNEKALEFLTTILPLDLVGMVAEPLAAYHIQWYLASQAGRIPMGHSLAGRVLQRTCLPLLKLEAVRRWIKGHTLYACFQKRA
jgi:2-polyprenyl-3-methyl-5-hydroxy-6-metoxy-1,4-benzoquinol methylase